jgi:tryptophan-rich hypothetical protein
MPKKQKFPHLLRSKWTACESTFGWRHFEVVNRKNEEGYVFAELESSCDPDVKFWINAKILSDRRRWLPGWKTLEELGIEPNRYERNVEKINRSQDETLVPVVEI